MILLELYSIRSSITEASFGDDEVKKAKDKLDSVINIITNAPSAENNTNFPRPRLRR